MLREIGLREHQKVMLNILIDFASFCDEHNLTYFLDAGTLLGAVRHHGFIPWDNDVDVCMLKPDFDKFLYLMEKRDYKLNNYLILERPNDTIYTFYKLGDIRTKLVEFPNDDPIECYVYIDIFCKVGLPTNLRKAKRICNKNTRLSLWHWFYKRSIHKWLKCKNPLKWLVAFFANIFVRNKNRAFFKQNKYIDKINKLYPIVDCKYVTTLSNGEYYRMCKKEYFDNYELCEFEGHQLKIPSGYDGWLRVLYGDSYMVPPRKNKQDVHAVKAFVR